jgi:acetylornithine/succinyldiaminopimelate/putrescine aminotransferase
MFPVQPYPDLGATTAAFADHLSRGKVEAFEALGIDIVLGRREGPFFWDAFDDRRFFNCHCNGGVFNLGHRNPTIVRALHDAIDREEIDVGNHHLVSGWKARLGERLAATTRGHCPGMVFSPSGSEAVEVALKTAIAVSGRREIVSIHGAFHGHTALAASAADARYHEPYRLGLEGFVHVPYDDLGAMDAAIGDDTAAVILETIPATATCLLCARCATSAGRCSCSTRCRPGSGAAAACGATSTTASSPTSSSRARASAAASTRSPRRS